jgi:hypothetical protein
MSRQQSTRSNPHRLFHEGLLPGFLPPFASLLALATAETSYGKFGKEDKWVVNDSIGLQFLKSKGFPPALLVYLSKVCLCHLFFFLRQESGP